MSSVGPKDPPTTDEWEVLVDIRGPAAPPEEESVPDRPANETSPRPAAAPTAAQPESPRPDIEERIRAAAAEATEAAEQRAIEEIHALGEDLKRAESDASTKLEGLEDRLKEMESRVGEADRLRAEAEARADRAEQDVEEAKARADRAEQEVEEAKAQLEEAQSWEQAQSGAMPGDREAVEPANAVAMPGDRETEERATATATETGLVSLSTATFDDLRGLGMSVTQAKRILAYRERLDGFDSVDELDQVPGFPRSFLTEIKRELTL